MKIGLCGTQSVGKTTLVKSLGELPEFKDYYITTERSKYLMELGIPLNTDSTLNGQTIFLSERVSELMRPKLITDRTVLDVIAFTKCAKSINVLDKEAFEEYAKLFINQYDYIFYVNPIGTTMENNGVRETDIEFRSTIDFFIQRITDRYSYRMKNFIEISGSNEQRVKKVIETIFP
jgi:deoxyadenosine/deoxycytidine kinase